MTQTVEEFSDSSVAPAVRGTMHRPENPGGDGLVLAHGAGGNHDAPLLVGLAEAFAERGFFVLRCDLPFRQQRATGPPRGNGAEDREGLRRAADATRAFAPHRIFLGGQSYGGRQASMLAAEDATIADGLLLLSYPLHPPGKPGQRRTAHLPKIKVPSLFVSGSKDPFGSRQEIQSALQLIPATHSFLLVEGAGHDLGYGRRVRKGSEDLPSRIVQALAELLASSK